MNDLRKIYDCDTINAFFAGKEIRRITKLDSVWRSGNVLFALEMRVNGAIEKYVFKALENKEDITEVLQAKLLQEAYPNFLPTIRCTGPQRLLMDHAGGQNLFFYFQAAGEQELLGILGQSARQLASIYCSYKGVYEIGDATSQIDFTMQHYGAKCVRKGNMSHAEYKKLTDYIACWRPVLTGYRAQTIHNDLNIANLLIGEKIKAIDPKYDTAINDVAKDVGRYTASVFFNCYDYYKTSVAYSLSAAQAFVDNFGGNREFQQRVLFYVAQSALSFSNFKTNRNLAPRHFIESGLAMFEKGPDKLVLADIGDILDRSVRQ